MNAYLDSTSAVGDWLKKLAEQKPVYFPQKDGEKNFNFLPLDGQSEPGFSNYRPTIIPPGKLLTPDQELMFSFEPDGNGGYRFFQQEDFGGQIIAGVRPCDLKAIAQMDAVYADEPADPLYARHRQGTLLVAYACTTPCDTDCFCGSTGSIDFREGADVLLTPMGGQIIAEAMTDAGEQLLTDTGLSLCEDAADRRAKAESGRPDPFGRQLQASTDELPEILRQQYQSGVYAKYGERCFSCGTCNLVCPTCYCFEVCDDLNLDASSGNRTRTWDACMNPGFAEVAGGHNFRPQVADRQRHRIKRKFEYLTDRFGMGSFCVGCGRCGRQCTTGIDIFDMVNDIVRENKGGTQ